MALVTRELNNIGAPLYAPDGTILSDATVSFTLVNASGATTDAWDATTNERVAGVESTTTNVNGEFQVNLWPNDRSDKETFYNCVVTHADATFANLKRAIPSGAGAYTWVEFYSAGDPLTPAELSVLQTHIAASVAHGISTDELAAIDGANSPSAGNVFATIADVGGGGGGSGLEWSVVSTNTAAVDGYGYLVNSSGGAIVVTAPPTPSEGDMFGVVCLGSSETYNITVNRNGENIMGAAANMIIDSNRWGFTLVYSNAASGWVIVNEVNQVQW